MPLIILDILYPPTSIFIEFQQVIFNLINNAVAAMEQTGGKLTISAQVEKNMVKLDISDTGVGIPDKNKEFIFDPFFTTKKVGEGTGLGLSLCYGIVKKYGGNITFSSISKEDNPDAQNGSTFTVLMPVIKSGKKKKEDLDESMYISS